MSKISPFSTSGELSQNRTQPSVNRRRIRMDLREEEMMGDGGYSQKKIYNILMVGDDGVGKSCLANQFVNGSFKESDDMENCLAKNYVVGNEEILLKIWDFDGKERNSMLSKSYYEGSNAVIVMFDVSDRTSFDGVKGWLKDIGYYAPKRSVKYLVGNKTDLAANRIVSTEESQVLADKEGFFYLETSAKTRCNIETLFTQLSQNLLQTHFDVDSPENEYSEPTTSKNSKKHSVCCVLM